MVTVKTQRGEKRRREGRGNKPKVAVASWLAEGGFTMKTRHWFRVSYDEETLL